MQFRLIDHLQATDCHLDRFTGTYYWRLDDLLPWKEGRSFCLAIDKADMISIHNYDEMSIAIQLALGKHSVSWPWVGLYCPKSECYWREMQWADNTTFDYSSELVSDDYGSNSNICGVLQFYNSESSGADYVLRELMHGTWRSVILSSCSDPGVTLCKLVDQNSAIKLQISN